MIKTYNINFIAGGRDECDSNWTTTETAIINHCFKIYYITKGEASVTINNEEIFLKQGTIYFLNGYEIQSQKCKEFMDVYWLHFLPESIYLKYILAHANFIQSWDSQKIPFVVTQFIQVQDFFNTMKKSESSYNDILTSGLECRIHSVVLTLLSDLLDSIKFERIPTLSTIQKIKASLDFMDSEYIQNPSLEEIAERSYISPNYFHRIFTSTFKTTPHNYMLMLRLNKAIGLLSSSSLNVKEIAFTLGYENEFYFSRIFKSKLGFNPSEIKSKRFI